MVSWERLKAQLREGFVLKTLYLAQEGTRPYLWCQHSSKNQEINQESLVSQKREKRRAAFGRLPFRAHPQSDPSCHGPAAARKPTYLYRMVDIDVLPLDPKLLDSAFVFFSLRTPQTHPLSIRLFCLLAEAKRILGFISSS